MSALEKLKQLEPIQFRYKAELDPTQPLRAGFSAQQVQQVIPEACLLYTSPSPRDRTRSRMPSSA